MKKGVVRIGVICMGMYVLINILIAAVYVDNPQLVFTDQLSAEFVNPFESGNENSNMSNYTQYFDQFEGFVIVGSATEVNNHHLHLFALPNQKANVYRDIKIYIFSNQPCYYRVKVDDQIHSQGYNEWKSSVKATSSYSTVSIEVTLVNETNVTLPVFIFKDLVLMDNPWDAVSDDDDDDSSVTDVDEWIRMSRGEFNMFIATRIAVDIIFGFLGFVAGTSIAVMHADTMGIQRVI